jgi:hypothetical protein
MNSKMLGRKFKKGLSKRKKDFSFYDLMNLDPGVLRDVNGDSRGI